MRLSPVVFLAAVIGTVLVIISASGGGHAQPGHEPRPPRPTSVIAPAHAATPIERPAHFLDGDSRRRSAAP